jgi:hypothetical protein
LKNIGCKHGKALIVLQKHNKFEKELFFCNKLNVNAFLALGKFSFISSMETRMTQTALPFTDLRGFFLLKIKALGLLKNQRSIIKIKSNTANCILFL